MPAPDLSDLAKEPTEIYISLKPSHRSNVLTSVDVELAAEWREYTYFPTVELSPTLHRRVSEKAVAEFERWESRD